MAGNVVLTSGVRQNLLSLQSIADVMSATQTRLATGKKVNTPLDSAVNFFTSAGLQSRAGDLAALLDSMSNAIQTVNAADHGITSIVTTIQSMQSTLLQARQDSTWQSTSYTVDAATIGTAAVKNISFAGGATTASPSVTLQTGAGGAAATLSTSASWTNVTPAARSPVLTAANNFTALGLDMTTGDETYGFNVTDAGGVHAVSLTAADNTGGGTNLDMAEVVAGINTDLAATNVRARDNAGKLEFYMNNGATGAAQSITISGFAAAGTSPSALDATTIGFTGGDSQAGVDAQIYTFTVSDGTTTKTLTLDNANADTLANAINTVNVGLGAGNTFQAYDNNGKLGIREVTSNGATLTIGGASAATLFGAPLTNIGVAGALTVKTVDQLVIDINAAYAGVLTANNDGGKLRIQNLSTANLVMTGGSGATIDGNALNTATIGGNAVRKGLVVQFNQAVDQLDKFSADSSFNGVNLLQGDVLKVIFNEQSTSTLSIQAKDVSGNPVQVNSSSLGINALQNSDLDSNSNIDTLLNGLTQSLQLARTQASGFGSSLAIVQNRQDFTTQMINTLKTGADNLVVADTNEEGANMLALQTRQQLSIAALSLANQANQSVLRLFG